MVTFCVRKPYWIGVFLLLPGFSLLAQQKNYTLQSLVANAEKHFPALMQKKALTEASRAAITEARHAALPSLKLSDQLSFSSANGLIGTSFPLGVVIPTSGAIRDENNWQPATGNIGILYNEYELVNFGLSAARVKAAITSAAVAEGDLNKDVYLLEYQLSRLYFDAIKYRVQLSADGENSKRYQSLFDITKALTASGIKPGADSSLALAELSKAKIRYNQTRGKLRQLLEQLSYLSGVPVEDISIDTLQRVVRFDAGVNMPALNTDTAINPLLDYYQRQKSFYMANEALDKKNYLPKILLVGAAEGRASSISSSDQYQKLGSGLGYQRFNYAMGVAFVYNLFDVIHRKDRAAVDHFKTMASDYALQQQQLDIENLNRQASVTIATAESNLKELPTQLAAAKDVFAQKTAQYKAGLINLVDLTNASFVLYRSQTDYIEARNDWYLAELDKAVANGRLTQFIQTIK